MKTRAAAAAGLLAIAAAPAVPAVAATRTVRVGAFYFEDSTRGDGQVVVARGDRITFVFEGNRAHTATVGGLFDSGIKEPGQRYTTPVLTKVGTFTLFCQVHGAPQHGTRLVIRAVTSPRPSPSKARPAPSPSHRVSSRPSPSAVPTPSPRPTPSPSLSPTAAAPLRSPSSPRAVVVPTSTSPTPVSTFAPPDVAPAVALDDGTGWFAPTAIVLLAAALGAGAIAIGRRRRS